MALVNHTANGEIVYETDTKMYTVWNETFTEIVCLTSYEKVAESALVAYERYYN